MLQQEIKILLEKIVSYLGNLKRFLGDIWQRSRDWLRSRITEWWQIVGILLFAVIFLYYPIGGWLIHRIDTSANYKPSISDGRLGSIDVVSYLINREVHHNLWTPNLPFLFPSYFLDNMPAFQLGMMSAVAQTAKAFDAMELSGMSETAKGDLNEGAELLQYPGNVWLFAPDNRLVPVPSSNTQYKKGRKKINNFNREIADGRVVLERSAQNLSLIMLMVKKDINKTVLKIEKHIREKSLELFDFEADEQFYFAQGQLYAYSQILKALGGDFKNVLVKYDVYQQWTSVLKSLELATSLHPLIVRNAEVDAVFASNHLVVIDYFALRAVNHINTIINKLDRVMD